MTGDSHSDTTPAAVYKGLGNCSVAGDAAELIPSSDWQCLLIQVTGNYSGPYMPVLRGRDAFAESMKEESHT